MDEGNGSDVLKETREMGHADETGARGKVGSAGRGRRMVVAAVLVVAAVGAMLWLLRSGPEPVSTAAGTGVTTPPSEPEPELPPVTPAITTPLSELLEKTLQRFETVETYAAVRAMCYEGRREVWRVHYKRPHSLRIEQGPDGTLFIYNGARTVVLSQAGKKVLAILPTYNTYPMLPIYKESLSEYLIALTGLSETKALSEAATAREDGPYGEVIDGTPCTRFDLKGTMPGGRQAGAPVHLLEISLWFSNADGLLVRGEFGSQQSTARVDYQYDLPVDDALFALPTWVTEAMLGSLRVIAQDEVGRRLANAKVYTGQLGHYRTATTDEEGQAQVPWFWWGETDSETGLLLTRLYNYDSFVVESADATLAGLYTFRHLKLVFGEALKEILGEQTERGFIVSGERDFSGEGGDAQLSYDASNNVLTLRLTLRPKATVTGRVLDTSGNPLANTPIGVIAGYRTREETLLVEYGDLEFQWRPPTPKENGEYAPWLPPPPFPVYDAGIKVNTTEDGDFELSIPSNHPFQLRLYASGRHGDDLRRFPARELIELEAGARVHLDDIALTEVGAEKPQ